ncbi:MAG: thermonuclease family protein [Thermostichales cyanobacterium SZTDM-1c_bins_54]
MRPPALWITCLGALVLSSTAALAFGEKRVAPDTPYYFDNIRFDRYPNARIVKIVNGHTVIAQVEDETRLRLLRLAGIEAVTRDPYDQQAIELLQKLAQYKTVKLEGDRNPRDVTTLEPVEVYVWSEGRQMNAELVRAGLAIVPDFVSNTKYDNVFRGLQREAQQQRLGIWSQP